MGVSVAIILCLFTAALAKPPTINEDDPLVIKARFDQAAADLTESLEWLEVKIKKCMRAEVASSPNFPGTHYSEVCAGKFSSLLRAVYIKKLRQVKRFFVAYLIKNLEPFRVQYEDEILYLVFLLNFHITRDLKIREGLATAQKTVHFQVRPRRFQILLSIIEGHLEEFANLQDSIGETKLRIAGYLATQTQQLEDASRAAAKKFLEEGVGWTELR